MKKRLIIVGITLVLLAVGLSGCTQDGWTAYESNPIIKSGDQLDGAYWNDPSIVKTGSIYVMYLTANLGEPGEEVVPFRATSTDGIHWDIDTTPLILPGDNTSDFDHAKIETPSVIFFNGIYHMYYTGVQTDLLGTLSIGHATSTDGIQWSKDLSNPIISPTSNMNDWNGAQVAEPGAVVFNDQVYLYFTAVGLRGKEGPTPKRTIGVSISSDGYTLGDPIKVLEQGSLYPPTKGYGGYSTPSAMILNDSIHLFYDVVLDIPDFVQVAIHHAISEDGIDWVEDDKPIFIRNSFDWTHREIRAPCVIHDEGLLKMWFAGDDYVKKGIWGIGYAIAEDTIYH